MPIEMHCHTLFSVDGQGTPENLVDAAADRGVTTLSITEHNHLGSQARAMARAQQRGLRYITGIELDCLWRQGSYHFLAFGFDPQHPALNALVDQQHAIYPERFELCLALLRQQGFPVDRQTLLQHLPHLYPTHPSPVLNKWGCARKLIESPAFPDPATGAAMLRKAYNQAQAQAGSFCNFQTARDTVKDAGGVILLAHLGKYFGTSPADYENESFELLHDLLSHGIDGFELYHPANLNLPFFPRLLSEADQLNCLVSGGSDCHNAPGKPPTTIGSSPAPDEILDRLDHALAS
jgi:3',5'-nucleoside bisphosphate phosphatase